MLKTAKRKHAAAFSVIALMVCLFAFCSSLISYRVSISLFCVALFLMAALAIRSGRVLSFDLKALAPVLPWILVACIAIIGFVIGNGYDLAATVALISAVIFVVFATENSRWIRPTITVFIVVLLVFAITTIACYLFPTIYSGFIKPTFYADVPMAQDYRSGLASHYSHNGTFCAVGLILSAALSLYDGGAPKAKRFNGLLALAFLIALVLTTKRAHLLCGIFSIGAVYMSSGNQHKILKAIGFATLTILAVALLAPLVPGVEATVDRLTATFSGSTSFEDNVNNRTFLWNYAWEGFSQSPVFGHGWTSYCYRWPDGVTITYMAHNELLNLLYETGLTGTAIALFGCFSSLFLTYRTIRKVSSINAKAYLRMSLCIQVFFLVLCIYKRSAFHDHTKSHLLFSFHCDYGKHQVEYG